MFQLFLFGGIGLKRRRPAVYPDSWQLEDPLPVALIVSLIYAHFGTFLFPWYNKLMLGESWSED